MTAAFLLSKLFVETEAKDSFIVPVQVNLTLKLMFICGQVGLCQIDLTQPDLHNHCNFAKPTLSALKRKMLNSNGRITALSQ